MAHQDLETAYFDAFSKDFHASLIRLIASKCKDALADCAVYNPRRARSLYPLVRRTQIDENIETLVSDYPQIKAHLRKLGSNNWITEVTHEFVLLTVHKVLSRNDKVRPALQREMLAQSAQNKLFEQDQLPPEGAILYAQLKYGVAGRFPDRLSFVVIDFPDKDGNIVHSIDLLIRPEFASIPDEVWMPVQTEQIDDSLDLNLRSDARNKEKKTGSVDLLPNTDAIKPTDLKEQNDSNDVDEDKGA